MSRVCCHHGNHEANLTCCICAENPCDDALADRARRILAHARDDLDHSRAAHEREVAYVLAHGAREELPF